MSRLIVPLLLILAPCASAQDRVPGEVWLRYASPAEAGFDAKRLERAKEFAKSIGSAAFFLVYDGAVVDAWGEHERRFMCHSVRKSLLSGAYGLHAIDTSKTLADLGIDDVQGLTKNEKQARIVDLLCARSGVYHPAAYETEGMKKRRPARGSHAPGTHFWYNNWDFNALLTIFEKETGTKFFEEFERELARPLGMQDFRLLDTYYHLEPHNSRHP